MITVELRVANQTSTPLQFYLEPWAGRYTVQVGRAVRVLITAPTAPTLEWSVTDGVQTLTVHGPVGAFAAAYDGEQELRAE